MAGHISPKSTYYTIFGSLMVLTAITVVAAFINLGALNFPVAISIAILKATLVILFFMHVKYSSRLTKLVCGGAFFFLLILFGLTMTDYGSRAWHSSPRGTIAAGTEVTIDGRPQPVRRDTPQQTGPPAEGERAAPAPAAH
jgi:cytochrome c oxidase subunit 4